MHSQFKLLTACFLSCSLLTVFVINLHGADSPVAVTAQANLRLNEFMTSNSRSLEDPDELNTFPDWIELYNPGPDLISLDGLFLTNDPANPTLFPITVGLTIPAGGFLLFYADDDPRQGPLHTNFTLPRSNGFLGLYSAAQTPIDSRSYLAQATDESEGRDVDGGGNWRSFIQVTPGASNMVLPPRIRSVALAPAQPVASSAVTVSAVITDDGFGVNTTLFYSSSGSGGFTSVPMNSVGDTAVTYVGQIPAFPDDTVVHYYVAATDSSGLTSLDPVSAPARPSVYVVGFQAPVLFINEFMAENRSVLENPQLPGEFSDWIELYNPNPTQVSLDGLSLTDNDNNPTQYRIPDGLVIQPNGFLLFFLDNRPDLGAQHATFTLSRGGDYIGLFGAEGTVLIDGYRFQDQISNISNGRIPDGGTEWSAALCTTPAAPNILCNLLEFLPLIQK